MLAENSADTLFFGLLYAAACVLPTGLGEITRKNLAETKEKGITPTENAYNAVRKQQEALTKINGRYTI